MTTAGYKFDDAVHTPIDKLKAIIKADEVRGVPSDFGWLKDILDETLEEYAIREFRATAASIDAYNPLQVEMHLAEGSRLLDLCLNQRKEIYQLESQAILSALDICLSQQTLDLDEKVAQINLAASVKQAQLPPDDGKTALQDRYKTFRFSLIERLKLHNRTGSALHYGERVRFMRRIYVDNLRLAYQRVNAAWKGMAFAYRIKTAEPAYIPAVGNVLDSYVKWMRGAITAVEETDKYERVIDIRMHLAAEGLDMGLKERLSHTSSSPPTPGGDYSGKFTLTNAFLKQFLGDARNGIPADTDAVRLIGLDVGFVYGGDDYSWVLTVKSMLSNTNGPRDAQVYSFIDSKVTEERALIALKFAVTPPIAKTYLAEKEYFWQPPTVRIENVPAWTEGSARDHFKPVADPGFQNCSPFGEWKYTIDGDVKGSSRFTKFRGNPAPELEWGTNGHYSKFMVHDIVLLLRVAVRKSLHHLP